MKQSHKDLQLFLMASYQYYHRFTSLLEDSEYDQLSKKLLDSYEDWQDHQHAYLVDKRSLLAGTAYGIKNDDYPTIVKLASERWTREQYYQEEIIGDGVGKTKWSILKSLQQRGYHVDN